MAMPDMLVADAVSIGLDIGLVGLLVAKAMAIDIEVVVMSVPSKELVVFRVSRLNRQMGEKKTFVDPFKQL